MTCNNYINGICILNREACKFVSVGDGCPSCKATTMPVASFRQLADTYAAMSDCSVRRKKSVKDGAYSGKAYYINALANKVVREIIGKESHMAQYLLRRLKSKRMMETEGMIAEAQALGHSPRIAFGHYTNFENLKTGGNR